MQFRDLQKQYQKLKPEIDKEIQQVLTTGNFISGKQVNELEEQLAAYVGIKHCITCANGTDALTLHFLPLGKRLPMREPRLFLWMWRRIPLICRRNP